jgi:phage terminase large subunit
MLKQKLSPYKQQIKFFKCGSRYIAFGGARGGGKSHAARMKMKLLALKYEGIQILLLRRTLKELRGNHIIPFMQELKGFAEFKSTEKEFVFPNGSRITLGYCQAETDVLQFQGQAYDVIFLEEATQFTEFQFQSLTESNRSSGLCKQKFSPRMYFTCNPGGVGHNWVKRLFIDRDYQNSERAEDYEFIRSYVYDNKFLMENSPEYVRTLENLPENRRKAMLEGDWDIFDGQYFGEFSRDIHVIEPFEIPSHWKRYISLDYGLDMFAVLWYALDTQGNVYVYKELHESDLIISSAAKRLLEVNNKERYECIYAPPDLWNRRQDSGKSATDIFADNGVGFVKSKNDRVLGWYAVKEWLKVIDSKDVQTGEAIKTSKIKVTSNCHNLIKYLPQAQHDEKNPNDVANEPHEITHILDALRYFCMMRQLPTTTPVTPVNKETTFIEKENKTVENTMEATIDNTFLNY